MRAAKRLRLEAPATHTLRLLIENHLLMASVSQRRDLDDPAVIRNFARQIQTPETLNLLTLLTFADSQGTSDKLWNGFKDLLLWQLHRPRHGAAHRRHGIPARLAKTTRVCSCWKSAGWRRNKSADEELHAHFTALPPRYFEIHTARDIARRPRTRRTVSCAGRFWRRNACWRPSTAWQDEPNRGYNLVKVCTWDRAGLFSKIAGSFSAAGLNILSAQIFTRADGIALDTFFVNDARTGGLAPRERHDKFAALLEKVLNGEDVDLPALIARAITGRPAYQAYAGERMATEIHFDNEASDTRTLIEIETEDRLGLLYAISQTFTELALDISAARIVTERGAAIDSFYVREPDGGKVVSAERQLSD